MPTTITKAHELVERATGWRADGTGQTVLTDAAVQRLVEAVTTHNNGRVARFLGRAASAREHALNRVWSEYLHAALDEAWPIGHPAYRHHRTK